MSDTHVYSSYSLNSADIEGSRKNVIIIVARNFRLGTYIKLDLCEFPVSFYLEQVKIHCVFLMFLLTDNKNISYSFMSNILILKTCFLCFLVITL